MRPSSILLCIFKQWLYCWFATTFQCGHVVRRKNTDLFGRYLHENGIKHRVAERETLLLWAANMVAVKSIYLRGRDPLR